ncbi:glycosyltransferase family 32 protein [Stipitochalara longipes BDJ]|nr:glycosyltransferase family 32 protein [Stipitochalara longipes BDJ]
MIRRPASRGSLVFVLVVAFVVSILVHRSRFLFGLLLVDGRRDAVFPSELLSSTSEREWNETAVIPKIIHQTYKTEDSIPEHWRVGQQAVKELHPNWEYKFWTDVDAHSFISTHYPAFLPIYDSYSHPIQRVDALRYFLLYHYGGIYLDLDLAPYRSFTPLLQFPAFACLTAPTGISNDILGSVPQHPFYKLVIENLEEYDRNWLSGYITVMYSTGPLFFSAVWIQYLQGLRGTMNALDHIKVLVPGGTAGDSYGFFKNVQGGSWHGRETEVIFWMGRHWVLVTIFGFVVAFGVTSLFWWVCIMFGKRWGRRPVCEKRGRYELWIERRYNC